ncbi:peptidase [Cellulomonas sp. P5_C5]
MNIVTRTLTTGAAAAVLALAPVAVPAAFAAASPYPPPPFTCTVSVTTTTVGQTITVSCTGLPPGTIVIIVVTSVDPAIPDGAITISGTKSAEKTVAADGSVAGNVSFSAAGTYTIAVTDAAGATLASQTVTVQPAAAAPAAAGLVSTGTDVLPIALGAGALLAAGIGTVVLVRRKNTA